MSRLIEHHKLVIMNYKLANENLKRTQLRYSKIIMSAIDKKFPELSKYIIELPFKISETSRSELNNIFLNGYYNSSYALLKIYTNNQVNTIN